MANAVKPIPEGYPIITPYLIVSNAKQAIDFYKAAFNAKERMRLEGPEGKIAHAEVEINGFPIMLADEGLCAEARSPRTLGGSPVTLHLYVEAVDQAFNQALSAGATVQDAVSDKFYGDRSGSLADPFGHIWYIATHVEDVSPDEIRKRSQAEFQKQPAVR